mgnify:CR=1 FL=1
MQNFEQTEFTFDVEKMQSALKEVESIAQQQYHYGGTNDGGAICLTQIPGDKNSITGGNVLAIYWEKDESYEEHQRLHPVDEAKYSQFVKALEHTYFKEVYDTLSKKYKLGRTRLVWKNPLTVIRWHKDPEPRLHIPIITNKGCMMVIENVAKHMPADGTVTITNNKKFHNFFNGGEQARIHLVACVLEDPFN